VQFRACSLPEEAICPALEDAGLHCIMSEVVGIFLKNEAIKYLTNTSVRRFGWRNKLSCLCLSGLHCKHIALWLRHLTLNPANHILQTVETVKL